jgi:hypothetical protein
MNTCTHKVVEKNKRLTGKNQENPVGSRPDVENHPDVEDNYLGLHVLKLRLNAEIRDLYILI